MRCLIKITVSLSAIGIPYIKVVEILKTKKKISKRNNHRSPNKYPVHLQDHKWSFRKTHSISSIATSQAFIMNTNALITKYI